MSPQLKLKTAAEEIKEILRKHDIAAMVALHTPGHSEYLMHVLTSYSCAYQYEDNAIRFYSKRADFKTKEEHVDKLVNTANMLHLLAHTTGHNYMMLQPLSESFDKLVNAEHHDKK